MCGISGIIGEKNYKKGEILTSKLNHRGPDAKGIWLSNNEEFPATICHNRLSIIDLSSESNQPFLSKEERYVFSFNGEIFNYLELREDLKKKGVKFKTCSDTEVFLEGLILEGIDFQLKCNGMWAFCLWDREERTCLLSRDRFGIKPLYYSKLDNNKLAFASEMKALAPLLKTLKNSKYLDDCMKYLFNYECTDITVFEEINRLPPGHYLHFKDNETKIHQFWNTLDHINIRNDSYENQLEEWRDLFFDSVTLRMRSSVPIGSALSGGVDSSCVVAAMNMIAKKDLKYQGNWQHLFHSSFPGSSAYETNWAQEVANSIDIPLCNIISNLDLNSPSIEESFAIAEDPFLSIPIPMIDTYRTIKSKGISVTIDGHGSDELFIGYGHIKKAIANSNNLNQISELIAIDNSTRTGIFSSKEKRIKRKFIKERLLDILKRSFYGVKTIKKSITKEHDLFDYYKNNTIDKIHNHPNFQEMDCFNQVLYELFHFSILPTLLRNYDKYSMANSVEIRMPFMDWRLVCLSFSLPLSSKLGGTFTKRIQRDSLKGILLEKVRTRRQKIGWNAPIHEWFGNQLNNNINEIIQSNKDSKHYRRAKKSWEKFENINNPSWDIAQHTWKRILPLAWESSLKSKLWQ